MSSTSCLVAASICACAKPGERDVMSRKNGTSVFLIITSATDVRSPACTQDFRFVVLTAIGIIPIYCAGEFFASTARKFPKWNNHPRAAFQKTRPLSVLKTSCICKYSDIATARRQQFDMILTMIVWLRHLLGCLVSAFRSHQDLILENLALRQQLLALHARRPRRRLTAPQKLFWVLLRRAWAGWKQPLTLVTPRTVVSWHEAAGL